MSIGEGQKIGNYRILRRLGVGGMGAVYLAEHPLIGKKVALKVIHRELAGNKEVIARFFNEARAVNKIGNEHIVEIHDFGQSDEGEHFYIMEYLEGHTLADVLQHTRVLPVQRALHIAAQIAGGLAAAHSCGIIHRDLKPDNIMLLDRLGDHDFVKVLDFGLAKMIHDSASAKLTAAGVVLGTPQYMSPEACESKRDIDHRSDIYCLGILLFQMVTGQVPFEGQSMGEILVKHVSAAPPAPRGLNPEIPPSVEQIILRCLAKLADARFPTMKALRDALLDADSYLASSPPVMPSAPVAAQPNEKTMFGDNAVRATDALAMASTVPPDPEVDQRNFPLAPPPPSMMSAGAAVGPSAKTAFLDPGAAVPATGAPSGPSAKTAFLSGPVAGAAPSSPGPAAAVAGAAAKTAFMDASAVAPVVAPEMPRRTTTAVPDMNPPAPAANATMVIGTPEGYSDKPPAKKWPIVVAVVGVLVVIGGGVAALVWPGFLNDSGQSTASAATTGPGEGTTQPAPAPAPDSGEVGGHGAARRRAGAAGQRQGVAQDPAIGSRDLARGRAARPHADRAVVPPRLQAGAGVQAQGHRGPEQEHRHLRRHRVGDRAVAQGAAAPLKQLARHAPQLPSTARPLAQEHPRQGQDGKKPPTAPIPSGPISATSAPRKAGGARRRQHATHWPRLHGQEGRSVRGGESPRLTGRTRLCYLCLPLARPIRAPAAVRPPHAKSPPLSLLSCALASARCVTTLRSHREPLAARYWPPSAPAATPAAHSFAGTIGTRGRNTVPPREPA